MWRAVCVLAVVLGLGNGSGLTSTLVPQVCDRSCGDDGPQGQCPPVCPHCTCSTHVSPSTIAEPLAVVAPPAVERSLPIAIADAAVPSPDPGEILRVPRSLG